MTSTKEKIWQKPWGYAESIATVCAVLVVGFMLQLTIGSFDFYLLTTPVNLSIGGVVVLLSVLMALLGRRSNFARWISGVSMSVVLLSAFLVLTIIMGVTGQVEDNTSALGFDAMTRSWPFVLLYFITLISLGTLILRRFVCFKIKDFAFYLNHIGVWLLLFASGLGYADMERYVMYVNEGETQWRVYDEQQRVKELPIAIELKDFAVEFYPDDIRTPKRFSSAVNVYTEDGDAESCIIEVNKPLKIGHWTVSQYGYDSAAGPFSKYSSFLLVYDSWIVAVYVGILMMMIGSVAMIWTGKRRKGAEYDVE